MSSRFVHVLQDEKQAPSSFEHGQRILARWLGRDCKRTSLAANVWVVDLLILEP